MGIQGFTFDSRTGDRQTSSLSFGWEKHLTEPPLQGKKGLNKWLVGSDMLPNLVAELTAAQGTNVFHKEYLGNFLKHEAGIVNKAIFFQPQEKIRRCLFWCGHWRYG